jgi:hypothetical protein
MIDNLRQNPLFRGLEEAELEKIRGIASVHSFKKGTSLFSQGEAASGLYLVNSGRVKVYRLSPQGQEYVRIVGPETIAEAAVFSGQTYPASRGLGRILQPYQEVRFAAHQGPQLAPMIPAVPALKATGPAVEGFLRSRPDAQFDRRGKKASPDQGLNFLEIKKISWPAGWGLSENFPTWPMKQRSDQFGNSRSWI